MKIWTWQKMELRIMLSPCKLFALKKLPSGNFATFEDWNAVNIAKAELAASLIGCKCVDSMKQQEKELMEYRKSVCAKVEEWFETYCDLPEHMRAIERIIQRYRRQKKCHRNFFGPKAGIRCYCDEHSC